MPEGDLVSVDDCGRVQTADSSQQACRNPEHRDRWVVLDRECNYSAFNGYRRTPSPYSSVRCPVGGAVWRTKAVYVQDLPNAKS